MPEAVPIPRPRPPPGFTLDAVPPPPAGFVLDTPRAAAPPPPPPGFVLDTPAAPGTKAPPVAANDDGGSFIPEVAKGIAGGVVGTTGTMVKGVAGQISAVQQEQVEEARRAIDVLDRLDRGETVPPYEAKLFAKMAPEARAQARKEYEAAIAGIAPGPIQDSPIYQAGQSVQEFAKRTFPAAKDYENTWTRSISEGLGSTVPFLATAAMGPAGPLVGAVGGSMASSGEAIDRAVQGGATKEQIIEAVRLGGVPGLTEQLPIETLFERIPLPLAGKFAGVVGKVLGQAAAEGGQEAVQQAAQNLIARYVYKPDQDLTEGVLESAAIGGIVGGGLKVGEQGVSAVVGGKAQPATEVDIPAPPDGFVIDQPAADENAGARAEIAAAAGPESVVVPDSPPGGSPSPAAIPEPVAEPVPVPEPVASVTPAANPAQRAILRRMKWTDSDIDQMSAEEVAAEVESAGSIAPISEAEMDSAHEYAGLPSPTPAAQPQDAQQPVPAPQAQPVAEAAPEPAPVAEQPVVPPEVAERIAQIQQEEISRGTPADTGVSPELPANESPTIAPIDEAAHAAATSPLNDIPEPTQPMKEAGNYQKGHVKVAGLDISIENPKGSVRRGKSPDGSEWLSELPAHYGYIRDVAARSPDGEHVDVYIGDAPQADRAFIINQIDPKTGRFDEAKIVLGANDWPAASTIYDQAFSDDSGPQRRRSAIAMPVADLKDYLNTHNFRVPVKPDVKAGRDVVQLPRAMPKAAVKASAQPEPVADPIDAAEQAAYDYERENAADIEPHPDVEIANAPDTGTASEGGKGVRAPSDKGDRPRQEAATVEDGEPAPSRSESRPPADSRKVDERSAPKSQAERKPEPVDDFSDEDIPAFLKKDRLFSLPEDRLAAWRRHVNRLIAGTATQERPVLDGSAVLAAVIGGRGRVTLASKKVPKIWADHPDVPLSVWENLPNLIADPLFVYKGLRSHEVIIVARSDKGAPILVAVDGEEIRTITPMDDAGSTGWQRIARRISGALASPGKVYAASREDLDRVLGKRAATRANDFTGSNPRAEGRTSSPISSQHKAKIVTRDDIVKSYGLAVPDMRPTSRVPASEVPPRISKADEARVREIVLRVAGLEPAMLEAIRAERAPQWGITEPQFMGGYYDFVDDAIAVAMHGGGRKTAYHEAFHRLQYLFLNPRERQVLASETERLRQIVAAERPEQVGQMAAIELEAEAFAIWSDQMDRNNAAGLRLHIAIRRAWERIRQALRRVRNALRGMGYQTAEDVFGRAMAGKTAKRAPGQWVRQADGTMAFQPAWHGTPHSFDKFSLEHIGKGEGAQAFGWGLYFAGKKEVAEHYRKALSYKQIVRDFKNELPEDGDFDEVMDLVGTGHFTPYQERVLKALQADDWLGFDYPSQAISAAYSSKLVDNYDSSPELVEAIKSSGRLFKVDLPEDSELMDWDKPLNEQPAKIKDAFASLGIAIPDMTAEPSDRVVRRIVKAALKQADGDPEQVAMVIDNDEQLYNEASKHAAEAGIDIDADGPGDYIVGLARGYLDGLQGRSSFTGEAAYKALVDKLGLRREGADKLASEALRAAGIPGHRFLDSTSRAEGDGTHNYVIYDDSRINVLEYSLAERVPSVTEPRRAPGALVTQRISRAMQGGVARMKNFSSKDRGTRDDGEFAGNYLVRKWEDYLRPLEAMQKSVGVPLNDLNDAYLNARLMDDEASAAVQTMHDKYITPIIDALVAGKASLEEFHKFLYALHAEERNRVVGLRNPVDSDLYKAATDPSIAGASGMSTNQANAIIAEFRKDVPKYRALRQAQTHARAMLDQNLKNQRAAGLISSETYDLLTKQWENYVPLKGQEGMDEQGFWKPGKSGFDARGDEFKTALGRFSEADNVIAHAITQNEQSILRQVKNGVIKAQLRFLNEFDPKGENLAQVYWAGEDGLGDIIKAPDVYKRVIGKDGIVTMKKVPNPFSNRDDVVAGKVGGKTYYIRFKDPKVGLALRKMGMVEIDAFTKLFRPLTVWQSIVNTRANPVFAPKNIIRDALVGFLHLMDDGFSAVQSAVIVAKIPRAWVAVWKNSRNYSGSSEWDSYAKEFVDVGGKITFNGYRELEDNLRLLQKQVTRGIKGENTAAAAGRGFLKFITDLSDAGENGIRLSAYIANRKRGLTAKRSGLLSRELTVDFKKHGEFGPFMNSWFVFFNASLLGGVNISRRLLRSRKIQGAVGALIFAGMMQHVWNSLVAGDDEDGENAYKKMLRNEGYKFERQWVFFIPGTKDYVSFPMAFGYNAFVHLGMQGAAIMSGDKAPMAGIADAFRVGVDAFNPIGSGSLLNTILPTVLDPVVDIALNEDFAGREIYPGENRYDPAPPPDSYQSKKNTDPKAKWAAEFMNTMSGGNAMEPGLVDVHPDTLEYLWGFFSGGLGRFASQTGQSVGGAASGELEPSKVPFVKDFYGQVAEQSQRTDYFRHRAEVQWVEGKMKEYQETGVAADIERFQKDHKVAVDAVAPFKAAEKARRNINKQRRGIEGSDMAADKKKKALDALDKQELEMMHMARKAYVKAQGRKP